MMFRSKVFRRQEESGHFPPMRFYPRRLNLRRFPREIKRELVTIYNVRGRNSPSRCVEMGKRLGILPIEICDFYLNRRYPELKHVLRAEELRRERARANNEPDRTFFFNVFAGFKLQVTFRDLEDDSDDEPAPRAPRAVAPRARRPVEPAPEVAAAPPRRRGRPARALRQ